MLGVGNAKCISKSHVILSQNMTVKVLLGKRKNIVLNVLNTWQLIVQGP